MIASVANWDEYTKKLMGRPVRPFFTRALEECGAPGVAIDLGCGAGAETAALIEVGWIVHAIDSEKSALEATRSRVSNPEGRLQLIKLRFEDIEILAPADLIYSFHSLPFCPRDAFDRVLSHVIASVKAGGVLALTLFGPKDKWVIEGGASGISREALELKLSDFEIRHFHEEDGVGPTALEGDKHWHVFEVIAHRK